MGAQHHAFIGQQRVVHGRGLRRQHVESGARQFPVAQGAVEQGLIHQPAARGVDEDGAGLHGLEFLLEDHRTRGGARHVERDVIRLAQRLDEVGGRPDAVLGHHLGLHEGIIGGHRHAEGPGEFRHAPADATEAREQQALAVEFHRIEAVPHVPVAPADRRIVLGHLARHGQHQHQRVLGHGARVDVADDGQRNAARVERRHIHRVIAHAMARHDLELGCSGDHLRRHRLGAQHHRVGGTHMRQVGLERHLVHQREGDVLGGFQALDPCRVQLSRDQYVGHVSSPCSWAQALPRPARR